MTKKRIKTQSKYLKKYGRTVKEMARITGWSVGTVHAYLQKSKKRKELFTEIKLVLKGAKV
jgi:hypothetical protein